MDGDIHKLHSVFFCLPGAPGGYLDFFVRSNMKRCAKRILRTGLIFMVLVQCSVRNPQENSDGYPEIVSVSMDARIPLHADRALPVVVRVEDPQGPADIVSVMLEIAGSDESVILTDTGQDGDLISGDGFFTGDLSTAVFPDTGTCDIQVTVEDFAGYQVFWNGTVEVADFQTGNPPVLKSVMLPEKADSGDLEHFAIAVEVENPPESGNVDSVEYRVYPPLSPVPVYTGLLADDGTAGDQAGDGVYSAVVDLSDTLTGIGEYLVRFQAWNETGGASWPEVRSFMVEGDNDPPVLYGLNVRDRISRTNTVPFRIAVSVMDPQGPGDIKRVYFNSTKPDGTPASGNPFLLYDDGSNGDVEAGDQIYSLVIQISPQNDPGTYVFTFYAEDLSGALSVPLKHELTVTDEGEN